MQKIKALFESFDIFLFSAPFESHKKMKILEVKRLNQWNETLLLQCKRNRLLSLSFEQLTMHACLRQKHVWGVNLFFSGGIFGQPGASQLSK